MTAVLQLLKHYGFVVSGSDKAFYPPMGEVVRRTADRVFEGYSAEHLDAGLESRGRRQFRQP
jgi:UDP-N-acetylmuramate-alanine ligase